MDKLVIDSWSWVEYFDGTPSGKKVKQMLESGASVFSSANSLAEITSKFLRKGRDAEKARQIVAANSEIVPFDETNAFEAGKIHADMRKTNPNVGLSDAIVIATARQLNAKIVTGNPDFQGVKEAILI